MFALDKHNGYVYGVLYVLYVIHYCEKICQKE